MKRRILIVSATEVEADVIKGCPGIRLSTDGFSLGDCEVIPLVTGVGSVVTSWALSKWFCSNSRPDLVINTGIAGSFREDILIGEVVIPVSDCFADSGIESVNGFLTLTEAGLQDPDMFPFTNGRIILPDHDTERYTGTLRKVNAITVNTATGTQDRAERLVKKYDPDIETMEGATFAYVCSNEKVDFLAFRSISNHVGPRQKDKWNIPVALKSLGDVLVSYLLAIQ